MCGGERGRDGVSWSAFLAAATRVSVADADGVSVHALVVGRGRHQLCLIYLFIEIS